MSLYLIVRERTGIKTRTAARNSSRPTAQDHPGGAGLRAGHCHAEGALCMHDKQASDSRLTSHVRSEATTVPIGRTARTVHAMRFWQRREYSETELNATALPC